MQRYAILLFCFSIVAFIPGISYTAINPVYKECMQRGYEVKGDYCVFPDSSQCLLTEFNDGQCGQKWMTEDYCIPQGRYVWDEDKCCEGLVAFLPKNVAGQATCQPKTSSFFKNIFSDSLSGILLLTVILVVLFFYLRRQGGKRKR